MFEICLSGLGGLMVGVGVGYFIVNMGCDDGCPMNNCLIFALSRWFKRGGYLVIRRSRLGLFPHFIWAKSLGEIEHFVPNDKRWKAIPPPFFTGTISDNDDAKEAVK